MLCRMWTRQESGPPEFVLVLVTWVCTAPMMSIELGMLRPSSPPKRSLLSLEPWLANALYVRLVQLLTMVRVLLWFMGGRRPPLVRVVGHTRCAVLWLELALRTSTGVGELRKLMIAYSFRLGRMICLLIENTVILVLTVNGHKTIIKKWHNCRQTYRPYVNWM